MICHLLKGFTMEIVWKSFKNLENREILLETSAIINTVIKVVLSLLNKRPYSFCLAVTQWNVPFGPLQFSALWILWRPRKHKTSLRNWNKDHESIKFTKITMGNESRKSPNWDFSILPSLTFWYTLKLTKQTKSFI